ncbi:MAG: YccS family putative transporter [Propionivibrio sp.]
MVKNIGWVLWRQGRIRQTFSRSVRTSVALFGVMLACLALGQVRAAIPLLLGVIASALAETDDHWRGRLTTQCLTLCCFAAVTLAVQASFDHSIGLIVVLAGAAFTLTLMGALGERYRTMAAATLIMSIYAALALQPHGVRPVAANQVALLLVGAAWYGAISVAWSAAFPMLAVEQNMARLYDVLGRYLELKARLFEPVRGIDFERRRLALALHNGRVVEALNATKESLFSHHRGAATGEMPGWLALSLHQFFVAQDLHERASSSHENYELLAEHFFHSDVLYRCQRVLGLVGRDCLALAEAIRLRTRWQRDATTPLAVEAMQSAAAYVGERLQPDDAAGRRAQQALRALVGNLSAMDTEVAGVMARAVHRMPADTALQDSGTRSWRQARARIVAHLNLQSPLMRHAIRLPLALTAGYLIMRTTADSYGFWILLTIVFVCQPQYGSTLVRLVERVGGTLLGLLVGWALLRLFPSPWVQSGFVVLAAVVFFIFRTQRYALATAAITVFVMLSFNQVGDGFGLIVPRLLDTLAGSLIAGLAVRRILPVWNSPRLPALGAAALRAQRRYFLTIMGQYGIVGREDDLAYRIARRDAHNADAALSGALSAAYQEPKRVRSQTDAGTRFLVLAHTLLNYLSALGAHRNAEHAPLDDAVAAANYLAEVLESLAATLESGQPMPPSLICQETIERHTLSCPSNGAQEAEIHRILRNQLGLALRLLPPLREAANGLHAG